MPNRTVLASIVIAMTASLFADDLRADDHPFDAGIRYTALHAGGEPAADMPYLGIVFRYALNEKWTIGGAWDKVEFDFESPAALLGLEQDTSVPTIDSKVKGNMISAWIDRQYGPPSRSLRWFWYAGIGFSSPSASDAQGALAGGGTFDIRTDPGTEIIPSVAGGARWFLGARWLIEVAGRVDQHTGSWEVQDQVSGASTTVESFTAYGAHFLVSVRF